MKTIFKDALRYRDRYCSSQSRRQRDLQAVRG